jgi:hypothetical protein
MKKLDDVEKLILQEREHFDFELPDERIWNNISQQIRSERYIPIWKNATLMKSVAAACILLILGGTLGFILGKKQDKPLWNVGLETKPFVEFEMISQESIRKKIFQLKELDADKSIYADLQQIDQSIIELKRELKNIPPGQEKIILKQLRLGYQTKLKILDKILERLDKKTNLYEQEI